MHRKIIFIQLFFLFVTGLGVLENLENGRAHVFLGFPCVWASFARTYRARWSAYLVFILMSPVCLSRSPGRRARRCHPSRPRAVPTVSAARPGRVWTRRVPGWCAPTAPAAPPAGASCPAVPELIWASLGILGPAWASWGLPGPPEANITSWGLLGPVWASWEILGPPETILGPVWASCGLLGPVWAS